MRPEDPQGVRYNWTPDQTEYQFFPEAYFSGSDVSIYFGDTWVDDLTGLEFQLIEKVRPVYGYGSFRADRIVHGNRIVQGTFRIAFRQAGYLYTILDHLGRLVGTGDLRPRMMQLLDKKTTHVADWIARAHDTIDTLLTRVNGPAKNGLDTKTRYANYEKTIWGGADGKGLPTDETRRYKPYFYRDIPGQKDASGNTEFASRLLKTGFDVLISYGPNDTAIGDELKTLPEEISFSSTVKSIRGLHLVAAGQVLGANGQPVEEVYQFMAFDLD